MEKAEKSNLAEDRIDSTDRVARNYEIEFMMDGIRQDSGLLHEQRTLYPERLKRTAAGFTVSGAGDEPGLNANWKMSIWNYLKAPNGIVSWILPLSDRGWELNGACGMARLLDPVRECLGNISCGILMIVRATLSGFGYQAVMEYLFPA